jgi:outer membrane biosynthesis protein TonB
MAILETKHEKKSMAITVVLHVVLIILLLLFGFKYLEPPLEKGIAVNFGTSAVGSGEIQPTKPVASAPEQNTSPPEPSEQTPTVTEEVVTQETEEAPVVQEEKKPTPSKTEEPVEEPVEEPAPEPKPDESTTKALENLINGPEKSGEKAQGEGNDNQAGDKGDPNGDPNADSYYGSGKGLDGDGNYRLGGRKALVKKTFQQECNQSGIVVVKIEVDRQGNVINAVPGVKGTTNSDPCLTGPAKRAALATKFNPDTNAPVKQVGTIIYEFKLSE